MKIIIEFEPGATYKDVVEIVTKIIAERERSRRRLEQE